MTDANDSKAVPCRDIDPVDLFEKGVSPRAYHNLEEQTQEVISDRSSCKVVFVAEKCSRCSARVSGIKIRGDVPELVHDLEWVITDVYEALYDDSRSIQFVDMAQDLFELGPDAVIELYGSLQLAVRLAYKDAEDGTSKRSKQEVRVRILGTDFLDA